MSCDRVTPSAHNRQISMPFYFFVPRISENINRLAGNNLKFLLYTIGDASADIERPLVPITVRSQCRCIPLFPDYQKMSLV